MEALVCSMESMFLFNWRTCELVAPPPLVLLYVPEDDIEDIDEEEFEWVVVVEVLGEVLEEVRLLEGEEALLVRL